MSESSIEYLDCKNVLSCISATKSAGKMGFSIKHMKLHLLPKDGHLVYVHINNHLHTYSHIYKHLR